MEYFARCGVHRIPLVLEDHSLFSVLIEWGVCVSGREKPNNMLQFSVNFLIVWVHKLFNGDF